MQTLKINNMAIIIRNDVFAARFHQALNHSQINATIDGHRITVPRWFNFSENGLRYFLRQIISQSELHTIRMTDICVEFIEDHTQDFRFNSETI